MRAYLHFGQGDEPRQTIGCDVAPAAPNNDRNPSRWKLRYAGRYRRIHNDTDGRRFAYVDRQRVAVTLEP